MARYIDADKLVIEEIPLKDHQIIKLDNNLFIGRKNGKTIELVRDYLKNAIENAPTEDVIPRSEVEGLKKENEVLSASNKTLALSRRKIEDELNKAKQDVAREIFEEIENFIESDRGKAICEDNSNDWFAKDRAKTFETYHNIGVENAKNTLRDLLDELKKKYIGEEK